MWVNPAPVPGLEFARASNGNFFLGVFQIYQAKNVGLRAFLLCVLQKTVGDPPTRGN
jgi:hypothetical protein